MDIQFLNNSQSNRQPNIGQFPQNSCWFSTNSNQFRVRPPGQSMRMTVYPLHSSGQGILPTLHFLCESFSIAWQPWARKLSSAVARSASLPPTLGGDLWENLAASQWETRRLRAVRHVWIGVNDSWATPSLPVGRRIGVQPPPNPEPDPPPIRTQLEPNQNPNCRSILC